MKRIELQNFLKRNRHFSLLWSSQGLSLITINMMNFVMATRIFEKTHSTIAVSFLWVFYFLPSLLFGPFSGYFVDLMSLRKTLVWTNIIQGICMLLFLFVGDKVYLIYSIIFLYSLFNQLYYPAESSSLPWLVDKKDLPVANSLFMLTGQTAMVIGLGFSGILMRLFGKDIPIYISTTLLFLAALAVYLLPKKEPEKETMKNFSDFFTDIKTGYSFIKDNRIVLFPLLIIVFFQILFVGLAVTIPSLSMDILKIETQDAGPLIILPMAIGAMASAFYFTRKGKEFRKKLLIKTGLVGTAVVLTIFSLILPLTGRFIVFLTPLISFSLGVAGFLLYIPSQTLLQENVPVELRGRIFGVLGFLCTFSTMPFLLFSAAIVETIGVQFFMLFAAIILFGGKLFFERAEKTIINEKLNGNGNK